MTAEREPTLFTIGHSTHPIDAFLRLLIEHGVRTLVDVRAFPGSRRNPQYNQPSLAAALRSAGLDYQHMVSLGGRRKSPEGAEIDSGRPGNAFAAYVAYTRSADFRVALDALEAVARLRPTAIMCAEAPWWKCHRQFIAEAAARDGFAITHIMPDDPGRAPMLPGV